jgi:RNA polymerase sigma-70 factor, ECF subfamily
VNTMETQANSVHPSLVCFVAPHSPTSFEELALPLLDSIYNFARWLARNEADAEDLVQEAYLKALRSFSSFEPGTNFKAWIFRILKNTFLSSRSSAHCRHAALFDFDCLLTELPAKTLDPFTSLVNRARFDAVRAATQELPTILRDVLVLCDLEEASYREAAQALSIPIGTVMSRLARARKAMRKSMQAMHYEAADGRRAGAVHN